MNDQYFVPFPNPNECIAMRGSTGVCMTMHDQTGVATVAFEMLSAIVELAKSSEQPWTISADTLNIELIARKVCDAICESEEVNSIPENDADGRAKLLHQLTTSAATSFFRRVVETIDNEIDAVVNPIRNSLAQQTENSPFEVADHLDHFLQSVNEIRILQTKREEVQKFHLLKRASNVFRRQGSIPESIRLRLKPQFENELKKSFFSAMEEEIEFIVAPKLEKKAKQLAAFCEELKQKASNIRSSIDRLVKTFKDRPNKIANQQVVPKNSIILEITGLDSNEIFNSLQASLRCRDAMELHSVVADSIRGQLSAIAKRDRLPIDVSAKLIELLARIDDDAVAEVFQEFINNNIGEYLSIYQAVNRFGVTEFADEIVGKSKVITRLGSNDKDELNVFPTKLFRIKLPATLAGDDAKIRNELERELEFRLPGISKVYLGNDQKQITLIQLCGFFPICIENHNPDLLQMYEQSSHHDHLPHLLGIIDGIDGPHDPVVLDLARNILGEE